jgi:transposase
VQDSTLWRALIGVENTVLEGVEYDEERQVVTVRVRPAARRQNRCGRCERPARRYDHGRGDPRHWRTLDLGTIQCRLQASVPRVRCHEHGVVVAHVPWARHGARSTRVFDEHVAWLATQTSKQAVTELMRIAWRTVGAVITRVWAEVESRVDLMAGLSRIGIDEVSYRRGRLYLMVVIDHDTGRLVWAGIGQTKATLAGFFDLLGPERTSQITHVTADSAGYIADVVAERCPDAIQAADPFHVVKWANDALGEVRLTAWREAKAAVRANPPRRGRPAKNAAPHAGTATVKMLTRSRYALWKNPENLTERQNLQLRWIADTDPRLWRAYQLKEGLRTILKLPIAEATEAIDSWINSARRCQIPQFVKLAKTVEATRGPILLAIEHELSNGRTEAVNLRIRLRTRMAYGFRDPHALIAILMLTLGGHRPQLPGR